jgi:molybdopterin-synthase adenylyltransferase
MLSDSQIERYSRQIILPQVGGKGQEKLLRACVLVNGNGPLQTAALCYLAAAGVGTIGVLASGSFFALSALVVDQRNATSNILTRLNPDCTVVIHSPEDASHPEQLVQGYDLVLSGPDPLHEACYVSRRPFVCAQVSGPTAWLFSCRGYEPDQPCLHCLPARPYQTREGASFVGLAALFLGTLQTTEALKLILGLNQSSSGKLFQCHFPALHFHEHIVKKNPNCPLCGQSTS